jgi:LuxR family maltose regulon positive regulatory protein
LVARARLIERLNRGAASTLTIVSAPAGFGKTTLLTDWIATVPVDQRIAWLSLDPADNDATLFFTYLIAALQTALPGVGGTAQSLLRSPQPPLDAVLATLLNDLDSIDVDVVVILDDYHLIEAREIQDGVGFLLDHLPAQVHLVLAGRADPALPIARLRARRELVEIRAAELRFTLDEVAAYLNEAMGLALTTGDVAALEGRTEGWIAALQLAALSMQGRPDAAAFIAGFAGDDRYIVDYLVEEVLARQPVAVRQFLLQTAILDRLSGQLCEAVTGQIDSQDRLAGLERANLFLVPLDDRRHWYRYHQLFADVLQTRLMAEQPGSIAGLHRRASEWFQRNGEPGQAIAHALAGGDFGAAADLVELSIPVMRRDRREAVVRGWLAQLPDDVVRARPVLAVGYAGALLAVGDLHGVEARLRAVEQSLGGPAKLDPGELVEASLPPGLIVVDHAEFTRLPATVALYRAALALAGGDGSGAIRHAGQALDRGPAGDDLNQAAAAGLLGLAHWAGGDLAAGYTGYAACMAGLYRAGHVADTFGCAIALADIRIAQGRLSEALQIYREALRRADQPGQEPLRGTADMYVGMSEIQLERGDLSAAAEALHSAEQLGEHAGLPQNPYRRRVAMALIEQALGNPAGALELLDQAERLYVSDFFPNVRPVSALRARLLADQGRADEALGWVTERGLTVDDEPSYLREYEHITLARVLLARDAAAPSRPDQAATARLLEHLLRAAESGGRSGTVIEILVLQAVCRESAGDLAAAELALQRALTLGEPEGYLRIFTEAGQAIAALLGAAAQGSRSGYVRRLRAAFPSTPSDRPAEPVAEPRAKYELIEPLSARELDVLRLLGGDLGGPEIARQLFLSVNTVRTHTKNIYAKLGVNNRRAAVSRGRELNLMAHRGRPSASPLP